MVEGAMREMIFLIGLVIITEDYMTWYALVAEGVGMWVIAGWIVEHVNF